MQFETARDLHSCFARVLSPQQAAILCLVYGIDPDTGPLTYAETADRLHVSVSTVQRQRRQALARLSASDQADLVHECLAAALPQARTVGARHGLYQASQYDPLASDD